MRCNDCQPLLLDHLYGLLEPAQAATLDAHLNSCAACAAARDTEARAAGLFARAARHSFPQVRFVPPTDAVPSSAVTAPARERVWGRWAVAAAVWALVPATVIPLMRLNEQYAASRGPADAAYAEAKRSSNIATSVAMRQRTAHANYAAAKAATEEALAAWVAAERAAEAAAKAQPAEVTVTRPESVQPGAPNEFVVALRPRGDALTGRSVTAEVRAGATVLHTQALNPAVEEHTVRLPADVWKVVAPGAELVFSVSTTNPAGARTELLEPIRLFGPVYATMLVTDRAAYRPGEMVRFRSLTLDRTTFRPPPHEQALTASLRKRDGSEVPGAKVFGTTGLVRDGAAVIGPDGQPVRGVGVGEVALPAELPEGDYVLTLAEVPGRGGRAAAITAPVTRTIRVETGATGRWQKAISYTSAPPGQAIVAFAEAKSGGRPLVGAEVTAVATIDGAPAPVVLVKDKQTNAAGRAEIRVVIPKDVPRGDARLRVTFRTADGEESVAERLVIADKHRVVEFFPEGGTLVAGVPNRVYVRATTPTGVPIGVSGVVSSAAGMVAKVEEPARQALTTRGLGVVTFTPTAGTKYSLKLDEIGGQTFDLPAAADGVAMTVLDPVTRPGQPVRVKLVSAGGDRNLVVGAYTRGRLSDTKAIAAKANEPVELALLAGPDSRGGVVRLTVFEDAGGLRPVAERLAFRRPAELLKLDLAFMAPNSPGESKLHVKATDERGNPAAAVVWAAAVASGSAPGLKDRSLPTHFLLAGEVETHDDLAHADFLLTDDPQAAPGLDLVLATQGWRRFAEQNTGPIARRSPQVHRLVAMSGATPVGPEPTRTYEPHWPRYETAVNGLEAARAERTAASVDLGALVANYEARRQETAKLAAAAEEATAGLVAARGWVSVGAVLLAMLAAAAAVVAYLRPKGVRGLVPLAASAAGAGLLALTLSEMADGRDPTDYALGEITVTGAADAAPAPSVPVAPPEQLAKVNSKGHVEPPEKPFFSGIHAVSPKMQRVNVEPPAPAPPVVIPDSELDLRPRAPGAMRAMAAPAPAAAPAGPADLSGAARLAVPIEVMFPDAKSRDAVLERMRTAVPWVPPLAVREYAAPRPGAGGAHPDTVLWRPLIVLPTDGTTTLSFFHGPAADGYEVVVAGHTPDGRIGTVRRVVPGARD